jgi:hypothetical protein
MAANRPLVPTPIPQLHPSSDMPNGSTQVAPHPLTFTAVWRGSGITISCQLRRVHYRETAVGSTKGFGVVAVTNNTVEAVVVCSCTKDEKTHVIVGACTECPIYTCPEHGDFFSQETWFHGQCRSLGDPTKLSCRGKSDCKFWAILTSCSVKFLLQLTCWVRDTRKIDILIISYCV